MDVLRGHCEQVARPFDEIERYCGLDLAPPDGRRGAIAESSLLHDRLHRLAEAGSHGVFIVLPNASEPGVIEQFGEEVIGRLA